MGLEYFIPRGRLGRTTPPWHTISSLSMANAFDYQSSIVNSCIGRYACGHSIGRLLSSKSSLPVSARSSVTSCSTCISGLVFSSEFKAPGTALS